MIVVAITKLLEFYYIFFKFLEIQLFLINIHVVLVSGKSSIKANR